MANRNGTSKIGLRILKIIAWVIVGIFTTLLLVILLIRIPYIQNRLVQKGISYLENKIGTDVNLKSIYIGFPKTIVLEELYVEDQQADTLCFVGELAIDTDLWGLLQNRIRLNTVALENSTVRLNRTERDSTFNFDYIVKAFADTSDVDTTKAGWEFSVGTVELAKILFTLRDNFQGNDIDLNLGDLELSMKEFNLSKSVYDIAKLELKNTFASYTQNKELVEDKNTKNSEQSDTNFPVNIDFTKIELQNVGFNFQNIPQGQKLTARIEEFNAESNKLDLNKREIDFEKIELNRSFISYHTSQHPDKKALPVSAKKKTIF